MLLPVLCAGAAFWFASRGCGYLRSYSADDVSQALQAEVAPGRPSVRVGAEDSAKSVGRGVGRTTGGCGSSSVTNSSSSSSSSSSNGAGSDVIRPLNSSSLAALAGAATSATYTCRCKALLLGGGADEQMAGQFNYND